MSFYTANAALYFYIVLVFVNCLTLETCSKISTNVIIMKACVEHMPIALTLLAVISAVATVDLLEMDLSVLKVSALKTALTQ